MGRPSVRGPDRATDARAPAPYNLGTMTIGPAERRNLQRLRRLLDTAQRDGVRALTEQGAVDLPRLYRQASTLLARLETAGFEPGLELELRRLVGEAHALLSRERPGPHGILRRAANLVLHESPRAIRAEARLLAVVFALFYGLALAAFLCVRADLELAWALLDETAVAATIEQLRQTEAGEPFRGNFTFGLGDSPHVAGFILAHNIAIAIVFFGSGLVPPLFAWILASNALMVGSYTAIAAHWGQAGAISSILWCHGVIELQMIVLAGTAGLVFVRAAIAPGPWTRTAALRRAGTRAIRLLAPVVPFLALSGVIEGFVSPHAPPAARVATAVATGLLLVLWVALGGRNPAPGEAPQAERAALLEPGRQ